MSVELLVYFDGQYWLGVLTLRDAQSVRAVRFVFGREPTNAEIYFYVRDRGRTLLQRAASASAAASTDSPVVNPKRAAREIARLASSHMPRTASQEALRLERETSKESRAVRRKSERDADAARKRKLRISKAKAKHRGH